MKETTLTLLKRQCRGRVVHSAETINTTCPDGSFQMKINDSNLTRLNPCARPLLTFTGTHFGWKHHKLACFAHSPDVEGFAAGD